MDWVAGTPGARGDRNQLDLKHLGITEQIVKETLDQAHEARLRDPPHAMLRSIKRCEGRSRRHAPRLIQIQINPEKIGLVIGPGGKTIRRLQEESGVKIVTSRIPGSVTIAGAAIRPVPKRPATRSRR